MSKLLGIDYGQKNVGLAISNDDQTMAFPKGVITNNKLLLERIKALCHAEGVAAVVMGESRNFAGEENKIMADIKMFKGVLEKELNLPVYLEPEFMTSQEASRLQGATPLLDSSAAALILKSFLARRAR
ncbi:MAG TPA: RuvX/YqgF family protein [Candidatus Paceibacterota bacterium]|nr:RuvX/YqgF family protein [Candidatus Paceibacterota bacterium]